MNFNRLRTLAFSLLLFSLPVFTFAGPVSKERAIRVAKNVLLEKSLTESNLKSGQSYSIKNILAETKEGEDLIYIINFEDGGFAIISADDDTKAVLAYSTEGSIDKDNMPPQLEYFLEGYQSHVVEVKEGGATLKSGSSGEWEKYDSEDFTPNTLKADDAVGPLLTAEWGQSSSSGGVNWNKYTPVDANGSTTPTGCVATATSQIMYHHAFPIYGTGESHSYNPSWDGDGDGTPDFGTLSVNYTTDYDWSAMDDEVATDESALLQYHVGVAFDMNYAPGGSGASTSRADDVLEDYFDYSSNGEYKNKSSYTEARWKEMLLSDFNKNRPVQYRGSSSSGGGHSFILDGYNGSQYHVNFGWNGYSNGWYDINSLGNYSIGSAGVFNLYPDCQATHTVTTDYSTGTHHFVASSTITANNSISSSAKVAYRAGTQISLTTGFSVSTGSKFNASLKECDCTPTDLTINGSETTTEDASMMETAMGSEVADETPESTVDPALSIYPNPSKGTVYVKNVNEGDVVKVSTSNGQLLSKSIATGTLATIDLRSITNGVYYISVISDTKTTTEQIILSK